MPNPTLTLTALFAAGALLAAPVPPGNNPRGGDPGRDRGPATPSQAPPPPPAIQPGPARPAPPSARPGPTDRIGPRPLRRLGTVPPDARPVPDRFFKESRPLTVPNPRSYEVFIPRATVRGPHYPDAAYWRSRDLGREIQAMARRGFIPVTSGGLAPEIQGVAFYPAGWRAYAFVVPPREKLHVRLHHPNEGWFRLAMVNRWGQLGPGMLQNVIPTGNPEVTYTNPADMANVVYVVVDDPTWMSTAQDPFVLKVDRSWDPAKVEAPELPQVMGLWAKVDLGTVPVPPKEEPAPKG
ncbi:hypothetical protein [Mesoterricola sediminis]|uniref:DUF1254 domain-containing protein n=1 Tax=Mesoterricola sediminis TaxID=2927980 RepID=A0AA48GMR1_9BACT|nr:hypothetical protein [Mesoterricola sediminis]BDU75941.1 hypothetical protein METESE_08990 [Mesoterricola sediminis]